VKAALAFLTPLPVGAGRPDSASLVWFPAAGALIGAAAGGVWWAAGEVFPPLVAAALVIVADLALTGALHVDGLADSADGMLSHLDGPERRLDVMAEPDIGAFGLVAVSASLLLRWAALASMEPDVAVVASLWALSRGAMAVALVTARYVGGGLGTAFLGARPLLVGQVAVTVPAAIAFLAEDRVAAYAALGAAAVAAALVVLLGVRRLGGVTGDVLGAAGVVAETVGLLVASARW
jgi:adenosylcobinamide-GDP ribazoletransferase